MDFASRLIRYDFLSTDEVLAKFNKLTKKEVINMLDITIKTVHISVVIVKEGNNIKYQYTNLSLKNKPISRA